MTTVDPLVAQWLQSDGLWTISDDAALGDRWGETALTIERPTTIATKADAAAEGARVISFRGMPTVEDVAELPGTFVHSIGTVITVEHPDLGYEAGIDVFVINAEDDRATGVSLVTFLRRL
ncbi:hypothetical protein IT881_15245 [Erythrobacter sp. A30-3]|nr:hypothetical protein IT881_15245 [Erythrobacter sp. A30-3]